MVMDTHLLRIEQEHTKEYILELYLNEIYFGRRSYGIASAAYNYFNKSIFDLVEDMVLSFPKVFRAHSAFLSHS